MAGFTPQEREWVLDSVIGSQALAGVAVSREEAARLLDEAEGGPVPAIGGAGAMGAGGREELRAERDRLRAALGVAVADHRRPPLDGPGGWISYCRFCGQPTWDYDHTEDCPVRVFDEGDS